MDGMGMHNMWNDYDSPAANPRRGSALLASLFAVLIIAGLGVYIVEIQSSFARRQCSTIDRKRSLYVAEAGLAEAVLSVSQGRSGALGSEEVPVQFHDGIYWVESEGLTDGRLMLTSRARVGVGTFTVRQVVRPNVHPIGAAGFFGEEGVLIGDAVIIDGYHSGLGSYDEQVDAGFEFPTTGRSALVRSNGDIVMDDAAVWPERVDDPYVIEFASLPLAVQLKLRLSDPTSVARLALALVDGLPRYTHILGTLRAGVDHNVETNGNTKMLVLDPAIQDLQLPEVIAPLTRRNVGGGTIVVSTVTDVGTISARAGKVLVNNGGELILRGPAVLHVDELKVLQGGALHLDDTNGAIHLHVQDALSFEQGSLILSSGVDAANGGTYVFVEPSPDPTIHDRVTLEAAGVFRGVLHAPGDRVTLPTGLRYFGSASARHLTVEDGAWLTYDEGLRTGGAGMPILPQQQLWQILEEEQPRVPIGFDPLADLARRAITPLTPTTAAPETLVIADYLDAAGLRQTYTGPLTDAQIVAMERVVTLRWLDPVTDTYREPLRPSGMDPDDLLASYRDHLRGIR